MQRIAGMTVKAQGDCEAWYNGQRDRIVETVKAEMARQRDALNAEMDSMREQLTDEIAVERDRADINTNKRNEFQAKYLSVILNPITHKHGPIRRALRAVENAWAMIWATAKCMPEIGESLGFWEIIREDEHHENCERTPCADGRQRAQEC